MRSAADQLCLGSFICKPLSPWALKSGHGLSRYILGSRAILSWTLLGGTWMENSTTTNPQWLFYDNTEYCSKSTVVTTKPSGNHWPLSYLLLNAKLHFRVGVWGRA